MAALFDITHPLHGVAAFLGILGFPFAAMMLGISLTRLPAFAPARTSIRVLSHLSWMSVVLMAGAFGLFMSQLQGAGIVTTADAKSLTELPEGVVPLVGWANRFLIIVDCAWVIVVARQGDRAVR